MPRPRIFDKKKVPLNITVNADLYEKMQKMNAPFSDIAEKSFIKWTKSPKINKIIKEKDEIAEIEKRLLEKVPKHQLQKWVKLIQTARSQDVFSKRIKDLYGVDVTPKELWKYANK